VVDGEGLAVSADLEATADWLDLPVSEIRRHAAGRHVCVDGRYYEVSCLVTDPECHKAAAWFLAGCPRYADARPERPPAVVTLQGL